MEKDDFKVSVMVNQKVEVAFDRLNDVQAWWTKDLVGGTNNFGDEFEVRFGDVHYSKQRVVEVVRPTRITWLVVESKLSFISDQQEWNNTRIRFELTPNGDQTQLHFTHEGLKSDVECFSACSDAWTGYIRGALKKWMEQ